MLCERCSRVLDLAGTGIPSSEIAPTQRIPGAGEDVTAFDISASRFLTNRHSTPTVWPRSTALART